MNEQFQRMQKLVFGKINESVEKKPLNESDLRSRIKELVQSSLSEKKKAKDASAEEEVEDTEVVTQDTIEPTTPAVGEVDPKVKSVQDHLQAAYNEAKALGDTKLVAQIGNSITYFTRTQVLGGETATVAENIEVDNFPKSKDELIEKMLKIKGDSNNTIDLNAYTRGLIDMYDELYKFLTKE